MILASVLVCAKFYNDAFYRNCDIASVSGLATPAETNTLEICLLVLINYQVFISPEDFATYEERLDEFDQECLVTEGETTPPLEVDMYDYTHDYEFEDSESYEKLFTNDNSNTVSVYESPQGTFL